MTQKSVYNDPWVDFIPGSGSPLEIEWIKENKKRVPSPEEHFFPKSVDKKKIHRSISEPFEPGW